MNLLSIKLSSGEHIIGNVKMLPDSKSDDGTIIINSPLKVVRMGTPGNEFMYYTEFDPVSGGGDVLFSQGGILSMSSLSVEAKKKYILYILSKEKQQMSKLSEAHLVSLLIDRMMELYLAANIPVDFNELPLTKEQLKLIKNKN